MDAVFGADHEVLEGFRVGGETCKVAAKYLGNGDVHGVSAFTSAPLAEDTGELAQHDNAVAEDADLFGKIPFE